MQKDRIETIYKWYLYFSVLTIILLSTLNHFLYDILPGPVTAIFAPISESLAEHVKIVFYPTLTWWCATFLLFKKSKSLSAVKWFTGAFSSAFISSCLLIMLCSVAFFALGIGMDSFVLHILIEIVSILIGQWIGYHVYEMGKERKWLLITIGVICGVMAVLMAAFSFGVPKTPIFFAP